MLKKMSGQVLVFGVMWILQCVNELNRTKNKQNTKELEKSVFGKSYYLIVLYIWSL